MHGVDDRAAKLLRVLTIRPEPPVALFGRADAGRRRAEHDGHPPGAVPLARSLYRLKEPIRLETEPGEPIVAALPLGECSGQRLIFEPADPPDEGIERRFGEVIGSEARAPCAQGLEQ